MRRWGRVILVVAGVGLLFLGGRVLYPAGTGSERNSLRGVKPMRVAVDKVRPDVASDGLDHNRLRAVMEGRLRAAGVPVSTGATNDLYLIVSTSPQTRGMYAVHLHLEARQMVALFHEFIRDPESRDIAATWRTSWIGILKTDELKQTEVELVKLVDQFIADWRIANLGRER